MYGVADDAKKFYRRRLFLLIGSFSGCRRAVDEFRAQNNITVPMHVVDEDGLPAEAVWWRVPL